ncbi:expressed unknown protein [Seminavis robusta]|uniref:Uncharacterized protein n=1 Tax=Seminavis robusta TaxID=568900 RepID=A0A9N8E2J2_9STRA|nr:expressed unknown protein [Seminavis robusta]|eukprot:Sro584_g170870.1 n/a (1064) ;mRNA; f:48292-51483
MVFRREPVAQSSSNDSSWGTATSSASYSEYSDDDSVMTNLTSVASDSSIEVTEFDYYESSVCSTITTSTSSESTGVTDILDTVNVKLRKATHLNRRSIPATVVSIMWENHQNPRTQLIGCQVLKQLALERANRHMIIKADGVSAIHFAMLLNTEHEAIQECACGALELLSKSCKPSLSWHQVVASLCDALETHKDHVGIQQRALQTLLRLAHVGPIELLGEASMREIAVSLKTHQNFRPIASIALELLLFLAPSDPLEAAEIIDDIVVAMKDTADKRIQAKGVEMIATLAMAEFGKTEIAVKATFEKLLDDGSTAVLSEVAGDWTNHLDDQVFTLINDRNKNPYVQKIVALVPKIPEQDNTGKSVCAAIAKAQAIRPVIKAMNDGLEHASIQMNGCIVLASLAINAGKSTEIRQAKGCATIVAAMTKHSKESGVQKNGCVALANIWAAGAVGKTNEESNQSLRDNLEACISAVVAALDNHPADVDIQVIGCRALHYYTICCQKHSTEPLPLCEVIVRASIGAMRRCKGAWEVQELGNKVLANCVAVVSTEEICVLIDFTSDLILDGSNMEGRYMMLLNLSAGSPSALVRAGLIPKLVRMMNGPNNDVKILELAAFVLHNVCLSSEVAPIAVKAGAIKALLHVMSRHQTCVRLQAACCDALWALANDLHYAAEISTSGGFEAVALAMKNKKSTRRLQSRCCMLLATLADGQHDEALLAARGPVLTAMQTNGDDQQVVEYGMRLLARLAAQGQDSSCGALRVVCAAMKALRDNDSIQVLGSSVLAALYSKRPAPAEVPRVLSSSIFALQDQSVGLAKLFSDLATVAAASGGRCFVGNTSIVDQLHEGMRRHIESASVQEGAVRAIQCLSRSCPGSLQLASPKIVQSIVSAMKRHPGNVSIQGLALKTFMNLLGGSTKEAAGLGFVGVASVVAETMTANKNHTELQRVGCVVLSKLSTRKHLNGMKDIAAAVESSLEENRGHSLIQKYGRRSLQNLQEQHPVQESAEQKILPRKDASALGLLRQLGEKLSATLLLDILTAFFILWVIGSYWNRLSEPLQGYVVFRF